MLIRHLTVASFPSLTVIPPGSSNEDKNENVTSTQAAKAPLSLCKADAERICSDVTPGGGKIIACLKQHKDEVSVGCAKALNHVRFTSNSDRESGHPQKVMSALPLKADVCGANQDVRFGPIADIGHREPHSSLRATLGQSIRVSSPLASGVLVNLNTRYQPITPPAANEASALNIIESRLFQPSR